MSEENRFLDRAYASYAGKTLSEDLIRDPDLDVTREVLKHLSDVFRIKGKLTAEALFAFCASYNNTFIAPYPGKDKSDWVCTLERRNANEQLKNFT